MNTEPIIEARHLKVARGGVRILDVPSFAANEGEVLALVGPNGAGKTTLLQTLAYLIHPFEGDILFHGHKVGQGTPVLSYRRSIAMAFQEPLLFDTTVYANVASGLKMRGWKKAAIHDAVIETLDLFAISDLKDRSARTLSGGEAQRASLARAFATRSEVLFLDEPFASLDPRTRESLLNDMQRILRSIKCTTLFVTHDLLEAMRLSDRMAVIEHGQVAQIGPPEEVMNHPANESVASFIGAGTILTGKVVEASDHTSRVSVNEREVEAVGDFRPGETLSLFIRPEHVTISLDRYDGTTSARNVFPAVISRITLMGFYEKIDLDCGFPLVSYVTARSREDLALKEGLEVTVSFKATAVHAVKKTSH